MRAAEKKEKKGKNHLYLKAIVLLHIKLRHLHTGFQVYLSVQFIFLQRKHSNTVHFSYVTSLMLLSFVLELFSQACSKLNHCKRSKESHLLCSRVSIILEPGIRQNKPMLLPLRRQSTSKYATTVRRGGPSENSLMHNLSLGTD